jgi:glycosyltransferase involved in cell wall biosynthesis
MRPLLISTSDIAGGAARAAYRLHRGLRTIGIESTMLVQEKYSDLQTVQGPETDLKRFLVLLRRLLDKVPLRLYPNRSRSPFHFAWLPGSGIVKQIGLLDPDVVNLHWVCGGMLSIEKVGKINKPIIWTLQDMWAFTGGCHYTVDCSRYRDQCGACPQLGSGRKNDLTHITWQRKQRAWRRINLTVVTPTKWMATHARRSSLFGDYRIEVIPFGLDLDIFKPVNKAIARDFLNLPKKKSIVMFGALDPTSNSRKGFQFIEPALKILKNKLSDDGEIELAVFGASKPTDPFPFPFPCRYLGRKEDNETLSLFYSAADVMVVPSIQEAFGQTASEALSCGTPVVTFDDTGPKDIVDHFQNGYLARPYKPEDLARGIAWILEDNERYQRLSCNARQKAEKEYGLERQARRYLELYKELAHKN